MLAYKHVMPHLAPKYEWGISLPPGKEGYVFKGDGINGFIAINNKVPLQTIHEFTRIDLPKIDLTRYRSYKFRAGVPQLTVVAENPILLALKENDLRELIQEMEVSGDDEVEGVGSDRSITVNEGTVFELYPYRGKNWLMVIK